MESIKRRNTSLVIGFTLVCLALISLMIPHVAESVPLSLSDDVFRAVTKTAKLEKISKSSFSKLLRTSSIDDIAKLVSKLPPDQKRELLLEFASQKGFIKPTEIPYYNAKLSKIGNYDQNLTRYLKQDPKNFKKYVDADVTKIYKGKVTGGSSRVLAKNINTPKGYAAHHIIPRELADHRALQKIRMYLDEAENGISLPITPGSHPTLPLHSGSHPVYAKAVKESLDKIPPNLSASKTQEEVRKIQRLYKRKLEAGNPLHEKYGGKW